LRRRQLDLGLERGAEILAAEADARGRFAEAHEPRVGAGARGETLRPDVHCLEEVRFPDAVCAGHEHDARNERKLEFGVRAKVSERDVGDDQPASLIGMIR
jgi:hypothetical protein